MRLPSWPSRARLALSRCRARISPLGHSLGQTRPYWAVPGPTPGTQRDACSGVFAGISGPEVATNAMLHTREVAGSNPAAPILLLILGTPCKSALFAGPGECGLW